MTRKRGPLGWCLGWCCAAGAALVCLAAAAVAPKGHLSPPVLEDVEQMCALLTSCDELPLPSSMIPQDFARCVRTMSDELAKPSGIGFSLTIRECGLRANTCAELRTCSLRGAKPDACVGRGGQAVVGYCDIDGRALSCFKDKVLAVRDCPRGGEQCAVREGEAYCALGPCPKDMPEAGAAICSASGTRILRCEKGKLISLDCAAFGLKCATSDGAAGCAADTPACTGGPAKCEGNVAVGCYHGHEVRIDCAAGGLVCGGANASSVGACAMPAPEKGDKCDPASPARCDGATIRYCAAGRPRTFLCKTASFNRCTTDARGARCGN